MTIKQATEQAYSQLDHIVDLVGALDAQNDDDELPAWFIDDYGDDVDVCDAIAEFPIEVKTDTEPTLILLCTGGPAVRLSVSQNGAVSLQCQDWGTGWENVEIRNANEENALDMFVGYFVE